MKWLVALFLFFILSAVAQAEAEAQAPASSDQKINSLVQLLQDPDVQAWLESRKAAAPPSSPVRAGSPLSTWEAGTRAQVNSIVSAIPRIPAEIRTAASLTRADAISHGYAPVFVIFGGLVAVGLAAEWLYRKARSRTEGATAALMPVAVFTGAMAVIFFAVDWPSRARIALLAYLSAFVCYRIGSVLIALAAPERIRRRARLILAVTAFALATAVLAEPLGVDPVVADALSSLFSLAVLLLAIEALWSTWEQLKSRKALGMIALIAVWLLWTLNFTGLFWLGIYAVVLPGILRGVGKAVDGFMPVSKPEGFRHVLIARGARAIVIALAVSWLAVVWRMSPGALGHRDPIVTSIFYGLLKSVIVLLVADLAWHLARNWIDATLAVSSTTTALAPADAARRARFRTLLPIFRNALAVMIGVMTVLIILAQVGVEIGPLIAGAGIFGVALGFGSQTLVKDIISGVFYMLDDAFRVGEYIQAKNYKGTVEGFSVRSVRLRHHRGPVFTVPFGELGAVENMSRDWVIDKFRISVTYDSDVEKARKLTKKIGLELMEDPELGPMFIEPLKMKGVEEFGDYGIVLSFGMTTVPGMQTYIRRKAHMRIREAFRAHGIEFAQPMVNVGGEEKDGGAAAAAAAINAQQAKAAATGT